MKALIALALACPLLSAACTVPGGHAESEAGYPLDPERILETCRGTYECAPEDGSEPFTIELFPGQEACLFDNPFNPGKYPAVLDPGGIVAWTDGYDEMWRPTPEGFEVYELETDKVLVACTKIADPAPSGGSGTCKGGATGCAAFGAGSCSPQKGCYLQSSVKYDGSLAYHCAGSPLPCSSMYGEAACNAQSGCVWE